jgi:phosphoribulokinase
MPVDILHITGNIKPVTAETLMDIIMDNMSGNQLSTSDGIGTYSDGQKQRTSYPLAISQLLTCYHLLSARQGLS